MSLLSLLAYNTHSNLWRIFGGEKCVLYARLYGRRQWVKRVCLCYPAAANHASVPPPVPLIASKPTQSNWVVSNATHYSSLHPLPSASQHSQAEWCHSWLFMLHKEILFFDTLWKFHCTYVLVLESSCSVNLMFADNDKFCKPRYDNAETWTTWRNLWLPGI